MIYRTYRILLAVVVRMMFDTSEAGEYQEADWFRLAKSSALCLTPKIPFAVFTTLYRTVARSFAKS
ncbi:hypothetical protein [Allorhodopirellula solitaria]|nr:hypothetical protein [Allorhodopirellula solitaria]